MDGRPLVVDGVINWEMGTLVHRVNRPPLIIWGLHSWCVGLPCRGLRLLPNNCPFSYGLRQGKKALVREKTVVQFSLSVEAGVWAKLLFISSCDAEVLDRKARRQGDLCVAFPSRD